MTRIVLASGNQGKLREFAEMLAGLDLEVLPQSAFDVPEAKETGLTFVESTKVDRRGCGTAACPPSPTTPGWK